MVPRRGLLWLHGRPIRIVAFGLKRALDEDDVRLRRDHAQRVWLAIEQAVAAALPPPAPLSPKEHEELVRNLEETGRAIEEAMEVIANPPWLKRR